jgi:hypothetical protein
MQWANLPELHQTAALDDSDLDCLEEIRDVLPRHRKLARFAVHLAHRHFELGPGEILIERPDPDGRTKHVTLGRLDDEPEPRPTTWLFEEGPELRLSDAVYCVCVSDPNKTEACIRHGKSRSPTARHQKDEVAKEREKARYEQGSPNALQFALLCARKGSVPGRSRRPEHNGDRPCVAAPSFLPSALAAGSLMTKRHSASSSSRACTWMPSTQK